MITSKQYLRLTLVVALPLLALGWWLADKESILPNNYVIHCEEFESHISCFSYQASDRTRNVTPPGAINLWGATLVGGLHHEIITIGIPEAKFVDGKLEKGALVGGGIRKMINLPPPSSFNPYGSCDVSPVPDIDGWGYFCYGSNDLPENFKFINDEVNEKFVGAIEKIAKEKESNDVARVRWYAASVLLPVALYFALSILALTLVRVGRYVIKGDSNS